MVPTLRGRIATPTFLILLLCSLSSSLCFAQAPQDAPKGEYVQPLLVLEKVLVTKIDGKTMVAVKAAAPDVPTGTLIDFVLTWRSMTLKIYSVKKTQAATIEAQFEIKDIPKSKHSFYFRTIIDSKKQSAKVIKAIRKTAAFRPVLDPWTDHHFKQRFRLNTRQELEVALKPIRDYFATRLTTLKAIDLELADRAELAALGESYATSSGQFDKELWRMDMQQDVIDKLIAIYKESQQNISLPQFLPYRRSLTLIGELSARAAARACKRSIQLYKQFGLPADKRDLQQKVFEFPPVQLTATLPFNREKQEIDRELGLILTDEVELPFEIIRRAEFQGSIWRHLESEEKRYGKFDKVRTAASWTPSRDQVKTLESGLLDYLQRVQEKFPDLHLNLSSFSRQYIGLELDGKKYIHVSLVRNGTVAAIDALHQIVTATGHPGLVYTLRFDPTARIYSDFVDGIEQ